MRRGLVIKIRGREEVAVVGYGYSGHAPPRRFGRKFANFTSAIQQGVVRMKMQMYEIRMMPCKAILNQVERIRNSHCEFDSRKYSRRRRALLRPPYSERLALVRRLAPAALFSLLAAWASAVRPCACAPRELRRAWPGLWRQWRRPPTWSCSASAVALVASRLRSGFYRGCRSTCPSSPRFFFSFSGFFFGSSFTPASCRSALVRSSGVRARPRSCISKS